MKYGYEDGRRGTEAKFWTENRTLKIKIYGSDAGADWITNLMAWPRKFGYHRGWYEEAKKLYIYIEKNIVLDEIAFVEVIGLSAGGAIGAIMCDLMFKTRAYMNLNVSLITVNSPSHGNKKRMRKPYKYKAMAHRGDIVRHLPILYSKPKVTKYGKFTWFWTAHNDTPEVWKQW